ncbi:MAG TPA: helicase C-terminal domain-containing protein, partial [Jiangellaceae bacterium]|nr:helicase C-terminal domain-containing protein [Jiangellaceae bacterium]
ILGVAATAANAAIDRLQTKALVWGDSRSPRLVRAAHEALGPFPAGLGPPAGQALMAHPPARLVQIATDLGVPSTGDPTVDADAVAAVLTKNLDDLLAELGDEPVAALRTLTAGPPTGKVDDARREVDRASARTPVEQLLAVGLLVPVDDFTVVLPREIGLHLRGGVVHPGISTDPPVPETTQRDSHTVDHTAGAGAFETVRRVETLLDAWSDEPPAVLRTGGLGVRDLRRLPRLLDLDEAGSALIADLAYAAGLVAPSSDFDEVWLPTPASDAWRRLDPSRQWTALANAWLITSRTAGLVGTRDERDRPVPPLGRDLDRPLAPEIRRIVLDVLARLPDGAAPERDGVQEAVRWARPRRGGRLRDDLVGWTLREAELLGVTGHGALASHARPLLDGRPPEAATKASVAALAAVLPEPLDHVLIQADLTAVAPGPLRGDLARDLAQVSDVESRGGATVHRFTAESVRRALDGGRTAAELHEFLGRVSRTPVPQPLTYLVDDVARQHGVLRVGAASAFIRCDDQALLAQILADPLSGALGLRRLAPTVLVSDLDTGTLLERLRSMAFRPSAEAADGSVVIARAHDRRAPARPAPEPLMAERSPPSDALLAAAVRAVRAGDRSAAGRPPDAAPGRLGRSVSAQTLADLRRALEDGATVWIGYVDHHGATSERVVDPVRLEGGWLAAFDHRSGEVRTFAVHRISGVAPVDAA